MAGNDFVSLWGSVSFFSEVTPEGTLESHFESIRN
jgi:hypothetical protein